MFCALHTSRTSLVSTTASNIRKSFGDVTGEEEVAADNELDERSKKMKKNKRNKKGERRTEGRKENCEKNKSNRNRKQWRRGIDPGTSVRKK